ncbi:hypothetical protein AGIG_G25311 [Arapaima gigas]
MSSTTPLITQPFQDPNSTCHVRWLTRRTTLFFPPVPASSREALCHSSPELPSSSPMSTVAKAVDGGELEGEIDREKKVRGDLALCRQRFWLGWVGPLERVLRVDGKKVPSLLLARCTSVQHRSRWGWSFNPTTWEEYRSLIIHPSQRELRNEDPLQHS